MITLKHKTHTYRNKRHNITRHNKLYRRLAVTAPAKPFIHHIRHLSTHATSHPSDNKNNNNDNYDDITSNRFLASSYLHSGNTSFTNLNLGVRQALSRHGTTTNAFENGIIPAHALSAFDTRDGIAPNFHGRSRWDQLMRITHQKQKRNNVSLHNETLGRTGKPAKSAAKLNKKIADRVVRPEKSDITTTLTNFHRDPVTSHINQSTFLGTINTEKSDEMFIRSTQFPPHPQTIPAFSHLPRTIQRLILLEWRISMSKQLIKVTTLPLFLSKQIQHNKRIYNDNNNNKNKNTNTTPGKNTPTMPAYIPLDTKLAALSQFAFKLALIDQSYGVLEDLLMSDKRLFENASDYHGFPLLYYGIKMGNAELVAVCIRVAYHHQTSPWRTSLLSGTLKHPLLHAITTPDPNGMLYTSSNILQTCPPNLDVIELLLQATFLYTGGFGDPTGEEPFNVKQFQAHVAQHVHDPRLLQMLLDYNVVGLNGHDEGGDTLLQRIVRKRVRHHVSVYELNTVIDNDGIPDDFNDNGDKDHDIIDFELLSARLKPLEHFMPEMVENDNDDSRITDKNSFFDVSLAKFNKFTPDLNNATENIDNNELRELDELDAIVSDITHYYTTPRTLNSNNIAAVPTDHTNDYNNKGYSPDPHIEAHLKTELITKLKILFSPPVHTKSHQLSSTSTSPLILHEVLSQFTQNHDPSHKHTILDPDVTNEEKQSLLLEHLCAYQQQLTSFLANRNRIHAAYQLLEQHPQNKKNNHNIAINNGIRNHVKKDTPIINQYIEDALRDSAVPIHPLYLPEPALPSGDLDPLSVDPLHQLPTNPAVITTDNLDLVQTSPFNQVPLDMNDTLYHTTRPHVLLSPFQITTYKHHAIDIQNHNAPRNDPHQSVLPVSQRNDAICDISELFPLFFYREMASKEQIIPVLPQHTDNNTISIRNASHYLNLEENRAQLDDTIAKNTSLSHLYRLNQWNEVAKFENYTDKYNAFVQLGGKKSKDEAKKSSQKLFFLNNYNPPSLLTQPYRPLTLNLNHHNYIFDHLAHISIDCGDKQPTLSCPKNTPYLVHAIKNHDTITPAQTTATTYHNDLSHISLNTATYFHPPHNQSFFSNLQNHFNLSSDADDHCVYSRILRLHSVHTTLYQQKLIKYHNTLQLHDKAKRGVLHRKMLHENSNNDIFLTVSDDLKNTAAINNNDIGYDDDEFEIEMVKLQLENSVNWNSLHQQNSQHYYMGDDGAEDILIYDTPHDDNDLRLSQHNFHEIPNGNTNHNHNIENNFFQSLSVKTPIPPRTTIPPYQLHYTLVDSTNHPTIPFKPSNTDVTQLIQSKTLSLYDDRMINVVLQNGCDIHKPNAGETTNVWYLTLNHPSEQYQAFLHNKLNQFVHKF